VVTAPNVKKKKSVAAIIVLGKNVLKKGRVNGYPIRFQ